MAIHLYLRNQIFHSQSEILHIQSTLFDHQICINELEDPQLHQFQQNPLAINFRSLRFQETQTPKRSILPS